MLFSKRLTLAPPLAICLNATTQGQSPSFQAELIPVRSPLLRESYLVPFPPLTYMLKFSGFADLTSCCAWDKLRAVGWSAARICNKGSCDASSQVAEAAALFEHSCMCHSLHPKAQPWHTKTQVSGHRKDHTCMRVPQALKQAYSQGYPESAMHVQESIGSRNSAIHNDYHTSLRPSSVLEPRYPSLKVVTQNMYQNRKAKTR